MLLRWDLEHPGQIKLMPAPIPTWDGVEYVDSAALPTFRTGDGTGPTFQVAAARLTITKATGDLALKEVKVEGTVSSAASVSVYKGTPSGGNCPGAFIGTATADVNGNWALVKKPVDPMPANFCIRSSIGEVATSPFGVN